jgi:hypothetical protein
MKIEFNPNRVTSSAAVQPAARSQAAGTAGDTVTLDKTDTLKAAIGNISLVRPEKVDAARALLSDTNFPPDHVLKAIASLIAEKME